MQPKKLDPSLMLQASSSNWFVGYGGNFVPILALRAYCFEIQALREFLVSSLPLRPRKIPLRVIRISI